MATDFSGLPASLQVSSRSLPSLPCVAGYLILFGWGCVRRGYPTFRTAPRGSGVSLWVPPESLSGGDTL